MCKINYRGAHVSGTYFGRYYLCIEKKKIYTNAILIFCDIINLKKNWLNRIHKYD